KLVNIGRSFHKHKKCRVGFWPELTRTRGGYAWISRILREIHASATLTAVRRTCASHGRKQLIAGTRLGSTMHRSYDLLYRRNPLPSQRRVARGYLGVDFVLEGPQLIGTRNEIAAVKGRHGRRETRHQRLLALVRQTGAIDQADHDAHRIRSRNDVHRDRGAV